MHHDKAPLSAFYSAAKSFHAGEPGRAIARNAIVITIGFLPLMASSLSPYVTVGAFFASLMLFTTLATLFILPSALRFVGTRIVSGR